MNTAAFPEVDNPVVSIVVVTYGGFAWVMDALQAVVDNTGPSYEVIVVDNASPDGTGPRLQAAVTGATVVLNDANVGFGAGANQGALLARGQHLYFLNSDAFVTAGWLPPLLAAIEDPAVAAVASRLVDPDGTLQEAGGMIGANGYAGQLGMGADPADPEFRFPRRVDFASAAALLVRRVDFLRVGGFHPAFVLGYFEDVDLCLELARLGRRTVYCPASVVTHLRGASTPPAEALRRATASHAVFVERWSEELDRRPALAELQTYPHRLIGARDFVATDRMLVVTAGQVDEALVRLLEVLARLWPTARLTLLAPALKASVEIDRLLGQGVEVAAAEHDWATWVADRRFHYQVVVVDGGDACATFGAILDRTQPQAARVQLARFTTGAVDVELEAARTADVVMCMSERAYELVGEWAPGHAGVVLPQSAGPDAVVDAMAGIGIAPPVVRC